jgi:hypothetical protein
MRQRSVVVTKLGIDQVRIRKGLVYSTSDTQELRADIYTPPGPQQSTGLPAVIIVSGDGPPERVCKKSS